MSTAKVFHNHDIGYSGPTGMPSSILDILRCRVHSWYAVSITPSCYWPIAWRGFTECNIAIGSVKRATQCVPKRVRLNRSARYDGSGSWRPQAETGERYCVSIYASRIERGIGRPHSRCGTASVLLRQVHQGATITSLWGILLM